MQNSRMFFTTLPVGEDFTNPTSTPQIPTFPVTIQNFILYVPVE